MERLQRGIGTGSALALVLRSPQIPSHPPLGPSASMISTVKSNIALQENLLSLLWRLPYEARRKVFRSLSPRLHRRFQAMRTVETRRGRSLKPFVDHGCLFVHITKCAGVSISRSLFGNLAGSHLWVPHYQLIFSEREFDEYFKFAFVRNPWDRLVSAFRFLKRGGLNQPDREWAEQNLAPFEDFHTFVTQWVDRRRVNAWKHFVPQYKFVCEPGQETPRVDFVGYFEHLAEDFDHVRAALGICASLEHHNRTKGSRHDYRTCYTPETRDIVAEVYAEDIRIFGYAFDSARPNRRRPASPPSGTDVVDVDELGAPEGRGPLATPNPVSASRRGDATEGTTPSAPARHEVRPDG